METIAPPSVTLDTLVMRIDALPSCHRCYECDEELLKSIKTEEPSGDLISREKAIESAEVHCATDGAYGYMDIKSIVEMLESIPSVSAEPKCPYTNEICKMCVKCDIENAEREWVEEDRPHSVSAERVIRCKDCKWLDKRPNVYDCHNPRFGDGNCYYSPPYVEEDGFCSWAERREE